MFTEKFEQKVQKFPMSALPPSSFPYYSPFALSVEHILLLMSQYWYIINNKSP